MTDPLRLDAITRPPSLVDEVSDRLVSAVTQSGLRAGDRLPSERELGEQFGVSRTVIREAIRQLTAKGVLETRPGSGVRVAHANPDAVTESLGLFMSRMDDLTPEHVHEVRSAIELATARFAALRGTDDELTAIVAQCDELERLADDAARAADADVRFHRMIAEATHNRLLAVLLDSISDVLLQIRRDTLVESGRIADTAAVHRGIALAMQRRDADAAVHAMTDHLDESREALTRHWHR